MPRALFNNAVAALQQYGEWPSLSEAQRHKVSEARARIAALADVFLEINATNAKLLESEPGMVRIREFTAHENLTRVLQDAARTDAKLAAWLAKSGGRIEQVGESATAAYNMTDLSSMTSERAESLRKLQAQTEQVYQSLWIAKGLLNETPKFRNYNPVGVRDVRNHLIEHTDRSGASIFSFGVATGGPVLRPMKPQGAKAKHDPGLNANVKEFLEAIVRRLK